MSKSSFTDEDAQLLSELGVNVEAKRAQQYTPEEERLIAGFEEISHFFEVHGRPPHMDKDSDTFEKVYAIRLSHIRSLSNAQDLLSKFDKFHLLDHGQSTPNPEPDELDDKDLLDELGVDLKGIQPLTSLQHVKPKVEIDSADEVATRTVCPDFDRYKPLFLRVKQEIDAGGRSTSKYQNDATIQKGDFYILGGQFAYVASMGVDFTNKYGRKDSRIKVVYDNGTQTDGMLMRSFQRALNKDVNGRRVEPLGAVSLFSDTLDDDDSQSGTIYVLRSLSNHPVIAENRNLVHKIGVTGGEVKKRISNAKFDPTFLMAEVEVVATYQLANINRVKLEGLIHKFFSEAQLSIEVQDRFGKTVTVKEWFLAPLFVIDQMINKLKSGDLSAYYYDKHSASIKKY